MCGLLLLPSIIVFIRIFWVKDKSFLLLITTLLLIGEISGLSVAYFVADLFNLASDLKLLLNTDLKTLERIANCCSYSVAIFFTCFNIAHWIFSMQYWSLALRLQCFINKDSLDKVNIVIRVVTCIGLMANLAGGAFIVIAFHQF